MRAGHGPAPTMIDCPFEISIPKRFHPMGSGAAAPALEGGRGVQRTHLRWAHFPPLSKRMPYGGPGVYPWSFQGGYGDPRGGRGKIEIPPPPLSPSGAGRGRRAKQRERLQAEPFPSRCGSSSEEHEGGAHLRWAYFPPLQSEAAFASAQLAHVPNAPDRQAGLGSPIPPFSTFPSKTLQN